MFDFDEHYVDSLIFYLTIICVLRELSGYLVSMFMFAWKDEERQIPQLKVKTLISILLLYFIVLSLI